MITVQNAGKAILTSDEIALESMRAGLLNLSAYAEKIYPQVEVLTLKKVRKGTIVVALSRLAQSKELSVAPLKPTIQLQNLSVKTGLVSLSFEKTVDMQRKISVLFPFQVSTNDVFSTIESSTEITLITTEVAVEKILAQLQAEVKSKHTDLTALTVYFTDKEIDKPNFYYGLLSNLAMKRISVVHLITSATEASLLINKAHLEDAVIALNSYIAK